MRADGRWLHRLSARIRDDFLICCLARLASWPPRRWAVARACFLQGHSWRTAAALTGLSLATVRREARGIRMLYEGITGRIAPVPFGRGSVPRADPRHS